MRKVKREYPHGRGKQRPHGRGLDDDKVPQEIDRRARLGVGGFGVEANPFLVPGIGGEWADCQQTPRAPNQDGYMIETQVDFAAVDEEPLIGAARDRPRGARDQIDVPILKVGQRTGFDHDARRGECNPQIIREHDPWLLYKRVGWRADLGSSVRRRRLDVVVPVVGSNEVNRGCVSTRDSGV